MIHLSRRFVFSCFLFIVIALLQTINPKSVIAGCTPVYPTSVSQTCCNQYGTFYGCNANGPSVVESTRYCGDNPACPSFIGGYIEAQNYTCSSDAAAKEFCGQSAGGSGQTNGSCSFSAPSTVMAGDDIRFTLSVGPNSGQISNYTVGKFTGTPGCRAYGSDNVILTSGVGECHIGTGTNTNSYTCGGYVPSLSGQAGSCIVTAYLNNLPGTTPCSFSTSVTCNPSGTNTQIGLPDSTNPDPAKYQQDIDTVNKSGLLNGSDCGGITGLNSPLVYKDYCSSANGCSPAGPVQIPGNLNKICVKGDNTSGFSSNIQETTSPYPIIKSGALTGHGYIYDISAKTAGTTYGAVATANIPASSCYSTDPTPSLFTRQASLPDLEITNFIVNGGAPGANTCSVSFTVKNTGNSNAAATNVRFSKDTRTTAFSPTCSTSPTADLNFPIGALPATIGTQSIPLTNFTCPATAMLGYPAQAMVDDTCNINESTETAASNIASAPYDVITPANTFWWGMGGDVTALGPVNDHNLWSFNISNCVGGAGTSCPAMADAGITSGSTVNRGSGGYSYSGTPFGWNLIGYPYQGVKYANKNPTNLNYLTLKDNIMRNSDPTNPTLPVFLSTCTDLSTLSAGRNFFYCYETPGGFNTALDNALTTIHPNQVNVVIPKDTASTAAKTYPGAPGAGNNVTAKAIVFVNSGLTVNGNINDVATWNNPTTGAAFIINGDLATANTVTELDGLYLFGANPTGAGTGGHFTNGSPPGSALFQVYGALLGLSENAFDGSSFLRTYVSGNPSSFPSERITGGPTKYLDIFKNTLGRPNFTYQELSPEGPIDTPPPCVATAPSPTTLSSPPADGATGVSVNQPLSWSSVSWGTNCSGGTNQYILHMVPQSPYDPTFTNPAIYTLSQATLSYTPPVWWNTRYNWWVETTNGSQTATSAVKSYTTQSAPNILTITAYGSSSQGVYPHMVLTINGTDITSWDVTGSSASYTYQSGAAISPSQVKVRFTNDWADGTGDRNLVVTKININGVDYLTTAGTVYSTGFWNGADCISGGFYQTDFLACNGYFWYGQTQGTNNYTAVGTYDGATCTSFIGWTCDQDNFASDVLVEFYEGSTLIGATFANTTREPAVGSYCGGDTTHGFSWPTPSFLKNGASHTISAYARYLDSNGNILVGKALVPSGTNPKTISGCF